MVKRFHVIFSHQLLITLIKRSLIFTCSQRQQRFSRLQPSQRRKRWGRTIWHKWPSWEARERLALLSSCCSASWWSQRWPRLEKRRLASCWTALQTQHRPSTSKPKHGLGLNLWFYSRGHSRDVEAGAAEQLMKVWLMVLTETPNSSTSALRQSKNAWTACLEAASGKKPRIQTSDQNWQVFMKQTLTRT